MIPEWRRMGYKIKLIFLYLPDVATAIERVKNRVKQGAATTFRSRLSDAGMKKAGAIFSAFTNHWRMLGFFSTIQGENQNFWMKEKKNEQRQNTNSRY
jgi:hypothetical protein